MKKKKQAAIVADPAIIISPDSPVPVHHDLFGNPYYVAIQALTWKQPFAGLMLHGKIETRTWNTLYRGLVLICAGKGVYNNIQLDKMCTEDQRSHVGTMRDIIQDCKLTGQAIAIGRLVDTAVMQKKHEEKCFVKYDPTLFVHIYQDVRPIVPFDFNGGQKWKRVSKQQILSQIKLLK